jgi:hypothetical protein
VYAVRPAQKPYISQVYASATNDKFVEVKNKDNITAIGTGQYFLALYANGAPTTGAPTSFVDLGAIPANGVKVFKANLATTPAYAVTGATPFNLLENYTGTNDLLLITTSTGTNAYNDRIDSIGDNTTHAVFAKDYTQETYASLVRVSCTPMGFPRVDYDEQDWVGFDKTNDSSDDNEILAGNKINGELGRHWSEDLTWNGAWNDISPDGSNPDRSRTVLINQPYNTSNPNTGSFEACSLVSNAFLTINPLTFTKVETEVSSTVPNGIVVENTGSLIQVRDTYYGVANQNLIHIAAQGSIKHARETIAINSGTDYVYWSSPLSLNPLNKKAGQLFNFGTASGQFNPSRFFRFENQNFYDKLNVYGDNGSGTDGYDDDAGYNQNPASIDYLPFSQIPSAINEHFIPGRGYVTWPPVGSATNYTITFEGEMNNGLVEVPVYRNDSQFGTDSNLIGNPYPSPIDLDKFLHDPVNTDLIKPVAFIWGRFIDDIPLTTNPGPDLLNFTEDNFKIYNPDMVIDPTQLPYANNNFINSGILASCQSFFVLAKDPLDTIDVNTGLIETLGNIRFSNYMRTKELNNTFNLVDPRGANNQTARTVASTTAADKLWLNLSDTTNYTAQLGIIFKENGLPTYSQNEDVETIQGRKYNFYTQTSTAKDLIIDVQDNFNIDKEIPLGILNIRGEQQAFTISIPRKEGVFSNQEVYLIDTLTGVQHNLSQSNYTFTTSQVITEGRFKLVFTQNTSIVANKTTASIQNALTCGFTESGLFVQSNNQDIKNITVFDLQSTRGTGFLITNQKDINTKKIQIPLVSNCKLISVKITLQDGSEVVKKLAR